MQFCLFSHLHSILSHPLSCYWCRIKYLISYLLDVYISVLYIGQRMNLIYFELQKFPLVPLQNGYWKRNCCATDWMDINANYSVWLKLL